MSETKREIEEHWTLEEVIDYHNLLDALEEAEAEALKPSK